MSIVGYNANTLGSIVSGAGILMFGTALAGISRGGFTFDPAVEMRALEADGFTTAVEGFDRPTKYASVISGTMLQASEEDLERYHLGAQFQPGATAGVRVLTPVDVNKFLAPGAYVQDVRMIVERGDGKLVCVHFPSGLVPPTQLKTQDANEGEFAVQIMARLKLTAGAGNINAAPYRVEIRDALPA